MKDYVGGKKFLKKIYQHCLESCDDTIKTLVVKYTNSKEDIYKENDFDYAKLKEEVDESCECEFYECGGSSFLFYIPRVLQENLKESYTPQVDI